MKWILQVNPGRFDIWPAYFADDDPPQGWDLGPSQGTRYPRHYDQMRSGDQAAIWICGDRGRPWLVDGQYWHAGVYGFARIADDGNGNPDVYEDPIEADSGWLDEDDNGQWRWWVGLDHGYWLRRPILRSELKADRRFATAQILIMPQAANPYPVKAEEWRAIRSRVSR